MSKMSAAEKKMKEENPSKWRYHYVVKKDPKKLAARKEYDRKYYEKRKADPKKKIQMLKATAQHRLDNMVFLRTYKESIGCEECGGKYPYFALQFDHVDPKLKGKRPDSDKSAILPSWGINRIIDEIAKCRVLCGTCHAIKTHESGDWKNKQHRRAKHNRDLVGVLDKELLKEVLLEKDIKRIRYPKAT